MTNYYDRRHLYSDAFIVDCYQKYESQIKAAKELGVSRETVARAVRRQGMQLTGRQQNGRNQPNRKITDEQLLSAINEGLTRKEIAARFGMDVERLGKRMKVLGVHAKPAPNHGGRNPIADTWHYTEASKRLIEEKCSDRFEYVAYCRDVIRIKCKVCGAVIERRRTTIARHVTQCEYCAEQERKKAELSKLCTVLNAAILSKTPRTCPRCGESFYSPFFDKKYCSKKCKNKKKGDNVRKRCRKYGVIYHKGITLRELYKRSEGVCQICGKPTNWEDKTWNGYIGPMHPTIDHIQPLAKGGEHSWDNVQLAHAICNSYKRDLEVEA